MTLSLRHLLRVVAAVALVAAVPEARAQQAHFRTLEARPDGQVVEVTAAWPLALKAALDSARATTLTLASAAAMSAGMVDAGETYVLPAPVLPRVRVVESDFDELPLPPGVGADTVLAELSGERVEAVGLGWMRDDPAITLVVRLLAYDEARGVVRRYRRLVVALDYGTSALAAKVQGSARDNPHLRVTRSVLADGDVYKVPVTREGIYRIDREFLSGLAGVSPDALDPANVRVYGNGGAPLPALNSAARAADLVETPVFVQGGGDGAFQQGDYVLFYGAAPRGWRYDPVRGWEHYVNPFSSENYYFIKLGGTTASQRVGGEPFPGFTDARPVAQVTGRYVRDYEEYIWSKENGSGLDWMSKTIRGPSSAAEPGGKRLVLDNVALPGFDGGEVRYQARVAIRSNPVATVTFSTGGTVVGRAPARRTVTSDAESTSAVADVYPFTETLPAGARLNVEMAFAAGTRNAPEAALDWIRAFYPQALRAQGDTLRFTTPPGETGRFDLALTGFSREPHVWDVTAPGAVRRLGVRAEGGAYHVQVEVTDAAQPREVIAFTEATAVRPAAAQARKVANQNLHGPDGYPAFVIVTPAEFRQSADELAEYRRQQGMSVLVADIQQVYNEFSGGLVDMRAVRDYFKFLYDRAPETGLRLRYALLFGDGHFNYRNLGDETQQATLQNWIPAYETDESLDPIGSFTSDDYFALLSDDEGQWTWVTNEDRSAERVDLGIGRFTVQTPEEAAAMVRKLKHYESAASQGAWRTRYTFVADDHLTGLQGSKNEGDLHTQNADVVADLVRDVYPAINLEKIYGVSYTREYAGAWRIPEMRRDILSALSEGTLAINYSGHGGEDGLAQEEVFTREDAAELENFDRLALFITATCSFGWWDLGREQSGAEALLLNPEGGAIALMTTVRLVFTSPGITTLNVGLNRELNRALFSRDDDGLPRRLGDVMYLTKNTLAGREGNNRKFNLLGDPTLRVGVPAAFLTVDQVNGLPVAEQPKLRALDRVTVAGSVRTPAGEVDTAFDGPVQLTVFDAERRVPIPIPAGYLPGYYVVREDLIWRGVVPAADGRFEATFVVPKDISYSDRPGRISAYATSGEAQASGFTESVRVGGTADNPPVDPEGPRLTLFLNDTTFVSGGLTPPAPRLIVKLEDESGINTVGAGVGHEMLLVVDADEQHAVDLSDNFESEPGSYRRGSVVFPLNEYPVALAEGPHTLTVRAWDVVNNSSTATLDFYVSASEELALRNVYNYPNPTSGLTRFIFEHNQPAGTPAEVQVRIYTLAGRPVRTLEAAEALPAGVLTSGPVQVAWDGLDEDFDPVASGVYLYKVRVSVEGPDGERRVSEIIEKLAIIR